METISCSNIYDSRQLLELGLHTIRPGGLLLTDHALKLCGIAPGSKVLDMGCGSGATVIHLRTRYSIRAFGIDPSATEVKLASEKSPESGFSRGEGGFLPFSDKVFSGVLCECVLSASGDQNALMREAWRVLETEGFLIVSDVYERGTCFQTHIAEVLQKHGFELMIWEDHTRRLQEFAAHLVLQSRGALLKQLIPAGPVCSSQGYYLVIAQKGRKDG